MRRVKSNRATEDLMVGATEGLRARRLVTSLCAQPGVAAFKVLGLLFVAHLAPKPLLCQLLLLLSERVSGL